MCDLRGDTAACGEIAASAAGTERTAACAVASVAVRTGEARVKGELRAFAAEGPL